MSNKEKDESLGQTKKVFDIAKVLKALYMFFYICFCVLWAAFRVRHALAGVKDFDFLLGMILFGVFVVIILLCILHGLLAVLYRKRGEGGGSCFILCIVTLTVLFLPYPRIAREVFHISHIMQYQEAAQYALSEYEKAGDAEIILPKKYAEIVAGDHVYILHKDAEIAIIFFPYYDTEGKWKGYMCYVDLEKMQKRGKWKADWYWWEEVDLEKLLKLESTKNDIFSEGRSEKDEIAAKRRSEESADLFM